VGWTSSAPTACVAVLLVLAVPGAGVGAAPAVAAGAGAARSMPNTAPAAPADGLCEGYRGVPKGFGPGSAGHPNRAGFRTVVNG
jgi:hypothetical protein